MDIDATIMAPNRDPMTTRIEAVWPSAWRCPIEYFNDGLYCDTGCGIFDPDCGRVRNIADDDYASDPESDGYWYTNPALKYCHEDYETHDEVECWIQTFDAEGRWSGEYAFEAATSDPNPADPTNPFGWVTWDNIDL